jgi:hypothetical protein
MGCCEPIMVFEDASNFYTKQEVNQKLATLDAKNLDVEDFDAYSASTKDTIDAVSGDVISEHDRAVAAENALNDQIVSATSGMATQEWVENQGYLTEHQSLSGYATEEWVEDQGYLTEHQSLSGYATESYVQNYTYDKQTIDDKVAQGGTFDPTQYYNKAATDALLDEKLDVTAYTPTDLSNYYQKNETSSKTEIADALAEKLAVSDFQTYSGTVASELSGKASQSTVDTLSEQIQSISSSTTGDVTVISGDVITISGDVASISNDLSAHTANTNIHVTTAQTSVWDAKQNALTAGSGISITNNVISVTGGTEGITSAQCQAQIDQSISGKTNQSDFSAHTANTSIHVTTAQTASWDAKSNFSGSYNDLTNKPTIPSIWSGTEAQWSQISGGTLDNNTIYLVF